MITLCNDNILIAYPRLQSVFELKEELRIRFEMKNVLWQLFAYDSRFSKIEKIKRSKSTSSRTLKILCADWYGAVQQSFNTNG